MLVTAKMAHALPLALGGPAAARQRSGSLVLVSGGLTVGPVSAESDDRLEYCVERGADYRGWIVAIRGEQVDAELTRTD